MRNKKGQFIKGIVPLTAFKKDNISWNKNLKGYKTQPCKEETKKAIGLANSIALKEYHKTEEAKESVKKGLETRRKNSWFKDIEVTKERMSESHKGKITSEETKQKQRESKLIYNPGGFKKGKENPSWEDGKSFEVYPMDWTELLREAIRVRDNHICLKCDKTQKENGRKLDVHHLDYDKKNCDPKNLVSLCQTCNLEVNGNREYWQQYFTNIINNIYA